jgi:hypothetical protein
VGPDTNNISRETILGQLKCLNPDSREAKSLESKLDQMDCDSRKLSDSEKQRYMQIDGSPQYVATVTRPDISFAASSLARFLSCPTEHLMKWAERMLRYLERIRPHKLTCTKSTTTTLIGYSDADWENCDESRKSTSGSTTCLNKAPIYSRFKRQPIASMSTTEAELVALIELTLQVKLLKHTHTQDLCVTIGATPLYCDNSSTATLAKDLISSDRTKHIEVCHRKVQELEKSKEVEVTLEPTDKQVADIFTKSLPKPAFIKLKRQLQVQHLEDQGLEDQKTFS